MEEEGKHQEKNRTQGDHLHTRQCVNVSVLFFFSPIPLLEVTLPQKTRFAAEDMQ